MSRKEKREKMWNGRNVLLYGSIAAVLVCLSFFLPEWVMLFKDNQLEAQINRYELKHVSLDSDQDILKKLAAMNEDYLIMDVGAQHTLKRTKEEALEEAGKAYNLFSSWNETVGLSPSVEVYDTQAFSYLIVTPEISFTVWHCILETEFGFFIVFVDDATGKMLSYQYEPIISMYLGSSDSEGEWMWEKMEALCTDLKEYYQISQITALNYSADKDYEAVQQEVGIKVQKDSFILFIMELEDEEGDVIILPFSIGKYGGYRLN